MGLGHWKVLPRLYLEVLLATDILATRAFQSTFQTVPPTTQSPFQDRFLFLSRAQNVHHISNHRKHGIAMSFIQILNKMSKEVKGRKNSLHG